MNNITLKQLRYFEALAQQSHFGRAADICAISQPALSVQIKDLELALGAPLFERGPRQVSLTAFGDRFAREVRGILRSVDGLGDLARAAQTGLTGHLRLGVIPTIAPYLLPALIGRLSAAYSDLDIHIRETVTPKLIKELTDGSLDAAIVALPLSEPVLKETPLFEENLVLVRHASDAGVPTPSRADLAKMRLLLLEEGHCFRDQALSFCALQSGGRREGLDGSSLATLVQMVGAGIGVTLVPEMALPVETRAAKVSIARFADPQPTRTVGMVWRKSNPLTEQLLDISKIVRQAAL
jgi:LysR family hydrogen peroxide-inducible transcriptional activator